MNSVPLNLKRALTRDVNLRKNFVTKKKLKEEEVLKKTKKKKINPKM